MSELDKLLELLNSDRFLKLQEKQEAMTALDKLLAHNVDQSASNILGGLRRDNGTFWKEQGIDISSIELYEITTGKVKEVLEQAAKQKKILETQTKLAEMVKTFNERMKANKDKFLAYDGNSNMALYEFSYHHYEDDNLLDDKKNEILGWKDEVGRELEELKHNLEKLGEFRDFLSNCTPNQRGDLLNKVNNEISVVQSNINFCNNLLSKIEDEFLVAIEAGRNKQNIFLDVGVSYTIRTESKTDTFYLKGDNLDQTSVSENKATSRYIPFENNREKEEVGIYTKNNGDDLEVSQYMIKGDPKSPEWSSSAFPKDEKNRWDHALRWANDILQHRSGPPYKPLYLQQGSKSPEEVVYLKEALEALIKLKIEMRGKQEPELLTDPNFSNIIVNQGELGLLGGLRSGVLSMYNKSTKDSELELFKSKLMENRPLQDVSDKVNVNSRKKGSEETNSMSFSEYKKAIKEVKVDVERESKKEIGSSNTTTSTTTGLGR